MAPNLIDVDCNLWHSDLKTLQNKEIDESNKWNILKEDDIHGSGVIAMLSPSSTIQQATQGLQLLENDPPPLPVKTTVGVHPYHVNDEEFKAMSLPEHAQTIESLLRQYPEYCAAVGECGLDASEGFPPLEDQIPWFQLQVQIAEKLKLPLFVHERLAFQETMDILHEDLHVPVIVHCFTGTKEECREYIKRGYHISVSGYILKESNDNFEEVTSCLKEGIVPLDRLMVETDAPYMGFTNCRQRYMEFNKEFVSSLNSKKRKRLQQSMYPNVPSSLPLVFDRVVALLQQHDASLTHEKVAEATTANAQRFFGL